jgi:tol-pal system protein YbgF
MIHRIARLAPLAALAVTAGCFATRNDLVVLQNDIATTRSELLAADSARGAQLDRVLTMLGGAQDTLRSINTRFTRFQGDVRTDMNSFAQQLLTVQEQLGVSQAELRRLRADIESRSREPVAPPPSGGTTGAPPTAANPPAGGAVPAGTPGPAQLYQLGTSQLQRGSPAAGRQALEDLVRLYPEDVLVPDALYFIGDAYQTEQNDAAADSVFLELLERFPQAQRAPEALYRHGVLLQNGGRNREARAAYERLIKEYPRSNAVALARDRLQTLP